MKISLTFLEGTRTCARCGLKKIDLDFAGRTLGDLLALIPANLGADVRNDLEDPALQLILNSRVLAAPFDLRLELHPGDQLTFFKALDGG
jgi:hypothetical protein